MVEQMRFGPPEQSEQDTGAIIVDEETGTWKVEENVSINRI